MSFTGHIDFLLQKHDVAEQQRRELLGLDDGHSAALRYLNKVVTGEAQRLVEEYQSFGSRITFLWTLDCLGQKSFGEALKRSRLKAHSDGMHIAKKPKGIEAPDAYLKSVQVRQKDAVAEVMLYKKHTWVYEDDRRDEESTRIVKIRLDSRRNPLRAEAFGQYLDTRKAIFTFLADLAGFQVPYRKGKEQSTYLNAIEFTESHVKSLAGRLGMPMCAVRGLDPTGEVGPLGYEGKLDGDVVQPLDMTVAKVAKQDRTKNESRQYRYKHAHADGFQESCIVEFVLPPAVPHIKFIERGSRSLATALLDEVCKEVGA